MSTFPTSIPSYLGFTAGHTLLADAHASQHNAEQADIIALANKLGLGNSTPANGLVLTSSGTGTSSWSQVNLTTMVSGVLPVANGGTGTSNSTGSDSVVLSTSPTITSPAIATPTISNPTITGGGSWAGSPSLSTPSIASFINAIHNHQNNAGGGKLDFGALLSTIFSGQVQTQVNAGTAGGTMSYINLGGIKLLWLLTSSLLQSPGTTTYTVTFPVGFFTTVTFAIESIVVPSGSVGLNDIIGNNYNATGLNFYMTNGTGSSGVGGVVGVLVIGT